MLTISLFQAQALRRESEPGSYIIQGRMGGGQNLA